MNKWVMGHDEHPTVGFYWLFSSDYGGGIPFPVEVRERHVQRNRKIVTLHRVHFVGSEMYHDWEEHDGNLRLDITLVGPLIPPSCP
jgi:hypothetical protein